MCLDDDDLYEYDCVDRFKDNVSRTVMVLTFAIALTALILAGRNLSVNHHQDDELKNDLADAIRSEIVIRTEVGATYYGVTLDRETNRNIIDHIPGSLLMPKTGALYEKSHCIIRKNSPLGVMYMMTQFESDFRGSGGSGGGTGFTSQYHTIQMAFEVPFGDVMDIKTGSGYLGYGSIPTYDIPNGGEVDWANENSNTVVTKRLRCAIPYCPDYTNLFGIGEITGTSPFAKLPGEHYVFHGELYERLAIAGNGTSTVYIEERVANRISCGCSNETPPRFLCSFPAASLNNRHGWFRLDIGFEYILKPIARTPNQP